ncbi:hypothetical protein KSP40_PGU018426 [Platanthera guangdongensis]|uniref:Small-subunit processome Utp12 domain-containing protein n=1 Tax=Platanthera guangdongensis TaxID=2320717 RepID=A0ABR2LVD9_9ASPA
MISPGVRDLLATFSPSSDFLAIASADGRIKIWDTFKGQLQTEFTNFQSTPDELEMQTESKCGHLAFDYKCMKWVQLESKKKKHRGSFLVLGTGGGDALAVEVSTGELRWRICDCHPGGVSAIAFSRNNSYIYTAGLDGMVCQIDWSIGSIISKFRSSTKGVSTLAISADGNVLAAAAGLLKIFGCRDNKKIQKFSGHPVSVRCMIFSEDGKIILTSGVGERHIAIWKIDGGEKKSASCVLSMEHPAIFLDSRGSSLESSKVQGLYVLALSEKGVCYFWFGSSIEELHNARPTVISSSLESSLLKKCNNQAIFAVKLDSIIRPGSGSVHVAHGSLVKPSFEKITVEFGVDKSLSSSMEGVLLPVNQSHTSNKGKMAHTAVTTLDSANAEDAILPLAKLHVFEKKRKHGTLFPDTDTEKVKFDLDMNKKKASTSPAEVQMQRMEVDESICIEDRLRAAGLLEGKEKLGKKEFYNGFPDAAIEDILNFTFDINLPRRKIRNQVSILSSDDACKVLELLVSSWKTRSGSSKHLFPWIYYILVIHGRFIISHESSSGLLENLVKMTRLKSAAIHPLLKLSGRLQLIMTQIDKAQTSEHKLPSVWNEDEDDDEADNGDIDEVVYGDEDESDGDE